MVGVTNSTWNVWMGSFARYQACLYLMVGVIRPHLQTMGVVYNRLYMRFIQAMGGGCGL